MSSEGFMTNRKATVCLIQINADMSRTKGVFQRGDGATSDITLTDDGIVVVQTSTDPELVADLQTHAAAVSAMAARGMQALHEMMM